MSKVSIRNDVLPLKDALYRLALHITLDNAEAEDIVQDTLLKLWNCREQWNEIENMEAFAMTICRNLALDHLKRMGNQDSSIDGSPFEHADHAPTPLEYTVSNDRIQVVRNIIDTLPEKQRSCVQLRDIEGKSYKQIAAIMNISEEQVKINIFRARQTIRQKFDQLDNFGV